MAGGLWLRVSAGWMALEFRDSNHQTYLDQFHDALVRGWCLLLLALFYWIIDVKGYRPWAFVFVVIGMNAIVAYMSDLIPWAQISSIFLGGLAKHLGMFGNFLLTFGAIGILWLGLYYMYRNRTFIRI